MLKNRGIWWYILTSWQASVEQIFEHFKYLFLIIKHNFCVNTLFIVISDHTKNNTHRVPLIFVFQTCNNQHFEPKTPETMLLFLHRIDVLILKMMI